MKATHLTPTQITTVTATTSSSINIAMIQILSIPQQRMTMGLNQMLPFQQQQL